MDQPTGNASQATDRPPQQQAQPPAGPRPVPPGYEFTAQQNQTIRVLASKMKFVGVFYVAVAVLVGFIGLLALYFSAFVGILYLIAIIPELLIGIWTINAATSFRKIVDTKGHDIPYMMNALGSLRKLYTLQFWLLILGLATIVLAIAIALFLWFSGLLPIPGGPTTVTMLAL